VNTINVALIQQKMQADYQTNLDNSLKEIKSAASKGAELIVLCELHTSLYFCQQESTQYFDLSQSIPGPLTQSLSHAANEHNVVIVGSIFEKRTEGLYHNTAIVFDKDGTLAGMYRKMHIPDDPGYHEKYYFAMGDLGFKPVQTSIGKLGVMVCWDQWFPEGARLMALAGAQILIYPTAIGWDLDDDKVEKQRQLEAWQTIQQSHAIANNLPLICVNRVGHETDRSENTQGIEFWGQSFVSDALGKITHQSSSEKPETLYSRVDLSATEQIRQSWPYLRDRRVDAYQDLDKRFIDDKN
jgi:N-carbamoylputrescine amidase